MSNRISVSGKKRRRTGARSSGKGKKISKIVMDKTGDDRERRDRLPQRVWGGTSYKVEVDQHLLHDMFSVKPTRKMAVNLPLVTPSQLVTSSQRMTSSQDNHAIS
ncbi:Hypothetical predicted protein, partial [Paramuricea clavata]